MKKNIIVFCLLALIGNAKAQVRFPDIALNSTSTGSSAFLDASSYLVNNKTTNIGKGLLYPRVDLTIFTAFGGAPIGAPTSYPTRYDGFIVYNTASSGVAGIGATEGNKLTPGFWYYENKSTTIDGGTWIPMKSPAGTNGWTLTGNAGTTAGTNFAGTTDAQDFVMKSNGTEGIRIATTGKVGIKTATPMSTLTVEGSLETAFKEITTNYTLTDNDYYVTYSGTAGATITLPVIGTTPTTSFSGRIYRIKNVSNNIVTLKASGANLIRPNSTNVATYIIKPGSYVEVVNNNRISGGVWDLSYVADTSATFNDTFGSDVRKLQYYGTPDGNKTLKHGPFEFRMIPSGRNSLIYQARINPDYGLQSGETVTVTFTQKKAWGGPDNGGSRGSITFSSGNWSTYQDPWERIFVENNGHNLYFSVDIRSAPSIANRLVQLGAIETNQSPMFYNLLVQNTQDTSLKSLISIRY